MDHRLGVNVSKTGNIQKVDQERGSQSNRSGSCYGLSPSAAHCTASREKERRGGCQRGEKGDTAPLGCAPPPRAAHPCPTRAGLRRATPIACEHESPFKRKREIPVLSV